MAYDVPNLRVELSTPDNIAVPMLSWRSVGRSSNAFVAEGLIDEAAMVVGKDPYHYRGDLFSKAPAPRGCVASRISAVPRRSRRQQRFDE